MNHKNKWGTDTCYNVDVPQKHAKWKKGEREVTFHDSTDMKCLEISRDEKQTSDGQGLAGSREVERLIIGYCFLLGYENVLGLDIGDGCTTLWVW